MLVASLKFGDVLVLEEQTLVIRRKISAPNLHIARPFEHCTSVCINGTIVAVKDSATTFTCWDLVTGLQMERFDSFPLQLGEICRMAMSDNAEQAATAHMPHTVGNRGVIVTWDVVSGCMKEVFQIYISLPTDLKFSPGGAFLVCSDEGGECTEL